MAKIAISLPDEVLEAVERERLGRSIILSRSEFIKRAVEQYLRTESERTLEEQYIRGYLDHPETEEDSGWLGWRQASMEGLREFYKDEPPWPVKRMTIEATVWCGKLGVSWPHRRNPPCGSSLSPGTRSLLNVRPTDH